MSIETRVVNRDGDLLTLEFVGIPGIGITYSADEYDQAVSDAYEEGQQDSEDHEHRVEFCSECEDVYKDGEAEHARDWFKGYRAGVEDTLDRRKRKARIAKAKKGNQ